MNKIILFFITLIAYIMLTIHLPGEYTKSIIIKDIDDLHHFIPSPQKVLPTSIILLAQQQRGLFIKSYLEKYRLIGSSIFSKDFIVEVKPNFYHQHQSQIGLSLFRIKEQDALENMATAEEPKLQIEKKPALAGRFFIGNTHFGHWTGKKKWHFFYHLKPFFTKYLPVSPQSFDYQFYQQTNHFLNINHVIPPTSQIITNMHHQSVINCWRNLFKFTLFNAHNHRGSIHE